MGVSKLSDLIKIGMRWYGPEDSLTLKDIRQAGATSVITALYDKKPGAIWPSEEIRARKKMIEDAGLTWDVVESIPVPESIKLGTKDSDKDVSTFHQTMYNLMFIRDYDKGMPVICYNFMPVFDWTRTQTQFQLSDGSHAIRYDGKQMAAFDLFILKRTGAMKDYSDSQKEEAMKCFFTMTEEEKCTLTKTIISGLPGSFSKYSLGKFKDYLAQYESITPEVMRKNLRYFTNLVTTNADEIECCVLAIHPDDPPYSPLLGLPRIVSTEQDMGYIADSHGSGTNGFTLCTGSYGARPENNLVRMMQNYSSRIHYLHLRDIVRENDGFGSFHETTHFQGDLSKDIHDIIHLVLEETFNVSNGFHTMHVRADHAPRVNLDDRFLPSYNRPGYPVVGRMLATKALEGAFLQAFHDRYGK